MLILLLCWSTAGQCSLPPIHLPWMEHQRTWALGIHNDGQKSSWQHINHWAGHRDRCTIFLWSLVKHALGGGCAQRTIWDHTRYRKLVDTVSHNPLLNKPLSKYTEVDVARVYVEMKGNLYVLSLHWMVLWYLQVIVHCALTRCLLLGSHLMSKLEINPLTYIILCKTFAMSTLRTLRGLFLILQGHQGGTNRP